MFVNKGKELLELCGKLRELAKGSQVPENIDLGICEVLEYWCDGSEHWNYSEISCLFKDACVEWEYYSGSTTWPVPSRRGVGAAFAFSAVKYANCNNLWADNEYGDLRRELCAHAANYFEQYVKSGQIGVCNEDYFE